MTRLASDVGCLHALLADACFGHSDAALAGDLGAYLAHHRVAEDDAAAILAAPRRLGLYRQLVRHNIVSVVGAMLERTRARLEAHAPGAFDRSVDAFLAEKGPRTPHLRDVPSEFLRWCAPGWRRDPLIPAWLADYAEFELVDFTMGAAPRPAPPPSLADVTSDRSLVFADPHVLVHLAWAVHELEAGDITAVPEVRAVDLLVYRDSAHCTRFLDLTPLASILLELLLEGRSLAEAMAPACARAACPLDDLVLRGAATLLSDLGDRGVLLGARAEANAEALPSGDATGDEESVG